MLAPRFRCSSSILMVLVSRVIFNPTPYRNRSAAPMIARLSSALTEKFRIWQMAQKIEALLFLLDYKRFVFIPWLFRRRRNKTFRNGFAFYREFYILELWMKIYENWRCVCMKMTEKHLNNWPMTLLIKISEIIYKP